MKNTIKALALLSLLLTSNIILAQNMINKSLDGYYNAKSNTLKITFDNYSFNGQIEPIEYKYREYFIVEGNNEILLIKFSGLNSKFYCNIDKIKVLKGDNEKLIKAITKNKVKENQVVFEFDIVTSKDETLLSEKWYNETYLKEKEDKIKEIEKIKTDYFNKGNIEKLSGKYKVKILKSGRLDYSDLEYIGEIHLSEAGFTFESTIPSIDLIRGSHFIKEYTIPAKEGQFSFVINKGFGKDLTLSLNQKTLSGAFTISSGNIHNTTTFTILEIIK